MKRLDIEIRTNGSVYKLWRRSDLVGLYKQYSLEGELIGYELFKIVTRPAELIKGVRYEEREVFASGSQFGVSAWSPPVSRGEDYVLSMFDNYDKELRNAV